MEPLVTENRVGVEDDLGQVGEDVAGTKSVDTAWVINKKKFGHWSQAQRTYRIPLRAHSTARDRAMCRTAASASQSAFTNKFSCDKRPTGKVIRGLGLRDVNNL